MKQFISFEELIKTDTGLYNYPNPFVHGENMYHLQFILNIIRHLVGEPIYINSGFRTPEVNDIVGGCKNSKHLKGLAADITCGNNDELFAVCDNFYKHGILTECIYYSDKGFIHVAL